MRRRRDLNDPFVAMLKPGGPLHGIVSDLRTIDDDPNALDFRLGLSGEARFYHGTDVLLNVSFANCSQLVYLFANDFDSIVDIFPVAQAGSSLDLLPAYLRSAIVRCEGDYRRRRKGYWQNLLSLHFGHSWERGREWLVIDREAYLEVGAFEEQAVAMYPLRRRFQVLKHQLQQDDPRVWGQPDTSGLGQTCDLLALGPHGELFCIELRHGTQTNGIPWGVLQAAAYAEVCRSMAAEMFEDVKTFVWQKVDIGLLPWTP